MDMLTTASQTIGPYWHLLEEASWADLTRFGAVGEVMTLEGHVYDGAGAPMTDACVEIWQASPTPDDCFTGFGRSATDAAGHFAFKTLKPGPLPGPGNSLQAPHIAVTILARGLLLHVNTRCYFAGAPENEDDPILNLVEPERRGTLMAQETAAGVWHLDIRMQGESETVFFEI
jgi:protocatechuate 3,4-dioxygenase alpha subunit